MKKFNIFVSACVLLMGIHMAVARPYPYALEVKSNIAAYGPSAGNADVYLNGQKIMSNIKPGGVGYETSIEEIGIVCATLMYCKGYITLSYQTPGILKIATFELIETDRGIVSLSQLYAVYPVNFTANNTTQIIQLNDTD